MDGGGGGFYGCEVGLFAFESHSSSSQINGLSDTFLNREWLPIIQCTQSQYMRCHILKTTTAIAFKQSPYQPRLSRL